MFRHKGCLYWWLFSVVFYRQTPRVWIPNENKPMTVFLGAKKAETAGRGLFCDKKHRNRVYFHWESRRKGVWHLYPAHFTTLSPTNVKMNQFSPKVHSHGSFSTLQPYNSNQTNNYAYFSCFVESICSKELLNLAF